MIGTSKMLCWKYTVVAVILCRTHVYLIQIIGQEKCHLLATGVKK